LVAWRKYRAGEPLVGMESLALDVILLHPEYHAILSQPARYRDYDYTDEASPFLHMSLHVALEEQLSIDQPPGIVSRFSALLSRFGDRHETLHQPLECLAETVWRAQRDKAPPRCEGVPGVPRPRSPNGLARLGTVCILTAA
jgi:uncharacterized protein DUF1841